jgi:chromosome segregation ATPase
MHKQSEEAIAKLRALADRDKHWIRRLFGSKDDLRNLADYFEHEIDELEKAIAALQDKCNSMQEEHKHSYKDIIAERDRYKQELQSLRDDILKLATHFPVKKSPNLNDKQRAYVNAFSRPIEEGFTVVGTCCPTYPDTYYDPRKGGYYNEC